MPELFPPDEQLLALATDEHTGAPYIPQGMSPYHLAFRRLQHRLLLTAARAGDLRVFQAGGLSVGVRPGDFVIAGQAHHFPGAEAIPLAPQAQSYIWIDATGQPATGPQPPVSAAAHIPLARATTDSQGITDLTDLRGLSLFRAPSLTDLGLWATPDQFNALTAGATAGDPVDVDHLHTHHESKHDLDAQAVFTLINTSAAPSAGVAIAWSLPQHLAQATTLEVDRTTGFLKQRTGDHSHALVGCVHLQQVLPGPLAQSLVSQAMGVAPADGVISDVTLSAGGNIESGTPGDSIALSLWLQAQELTATRPTLFASDGPGPRSTAWGDGQPATLVPSPRVRRGDLLRFEVLRSVQATPIADARDLSVLVTIRPDGPE